MKRLRIVVVCLAAALAFGLVPTASAAAAKGLVLRTPTQGVLTTPSMTWTIESFTDEFEDIECPSTGPPERKWEVAVQQQGPKYVGHVNELNKVQCTLPGRGIVSILPDPNPWSITMTPAGTAMIKGTGRRLELLAEFADGSKCMYEASKRKMLFPVAGPLHPVPLEPGDPAFVKYKLNKSLSGGNCPGKESDKLKFSASVSAPLGEEQVLVEN